MSLAGVNVIFSNGTSVFFPAEVCPQPAPSWAPNSLYGGFDMFQLAVAAEENPSFIAAENGSTYVLEPRVGTAESSTITNLYYATVMFNHYSSQTFIPCAGFTSEHLLLGQISVTFHKAMAGGAWDLANPEVTITPASFLNSRFCPPISAK